MPLQLFSPPGGEKLARARTEREREVFFLSRPLPHIENSTFRYVRPRYVIHAVSSNIPFSKAKNLIHVHICMCDFFQKKSVSLTF